MGLNEESREYLLDNLSSLEFNIIDLDRITEDVNDKDMNKIYDELDKNPKKSKDIERKMCNYWRENFYIKLSKLVEDIKSKR